MSHTPWTQEQAEKWARHYADSLHTLNCHTSKWQNARIDFLSGLEKAAEMIDACETVHGGENNMGTLSWSTSRMNDDTHSAKLVGVRPIEEEK